MLTRGSALLVTHEPVVVPHATRVTELLAVSLVLIVEPAREVSSTRSLSPGFAADRNFRFRNTQRLTRFFTEEPVSITKTASVFK